VKTPLLDVFRKEPKGLMWIAAVDSLESARAKIEEVRNTQQDEYIVFNQETGKEVPLPD
jgi:hypothetical protein